MSNLLEGLVRLVNSWLYLGYWSDERHSAGFFLSSAQEHKTINAFESSSALEVPLIQKYSLYHPRCGTGFVLILVLFQSCFLFCLGQFTAFLNFLSRILLLPVLVMFAYEYMRFSANHQNHPVFRYLSVLNMSMQRLAHSRN